MVATPLFRRRSSSKERTVEHPGGRLGGILACLIRIRFVALEKNGSGYSGRAALVDVEHSSRKKGSVNNRFVKKLSRKAVARQVEKMKEVAGDLVTRRGQNFTAITHNKSGNLVQPVTRVVSLLMLLM